MIIRRARPSEANALTALSTISKQSNGYDDDFMEKCHKALLVTEARLEDGEFWVAENGELCGCACLSLEADGEAGEVKSFFVHPESQRQGVGKLLWTKILQRAKDQNLKFLHLDADPFAVPFYEVVGFKTVRETPSTTIFGRTFPYMELYL